MSASPPTGPCVAPAVEVRGLCKTFPGSDGSEVRAVDDLSFTCRPGEILGLLGPNGAGKTTTLRILATILRPTGGTASVAGHDVVTDPDGVRSHLGYVSAATGIYERLTGRETLRYYGRLHGMDEETLSRRSDEVLRFLRMEDFADRLAGRLSSGQRQKVSLARAIIHDPPVLVLDEPTANLDVIVARNVMEFVERARLSGRAILLSTHLFHEVDRLCDRVAIMHEGRLVACGTPVELRERSGQTTLEDAFFHWVKS